jgi:DNA-binding response OmpR family regulator
MVKQIMTEKILLTEDDNTIAAGLIYAFEAEGYTVSRASTVNEARKFLSNGAFDLAVLDMRLPDGNGFEVRRLLPEKTAVLFLTVDDDEEHIVKAFEDGADDYITKPFRIRELIARVKSILGRRKGGDMLKIGELFINIPAGEVFINGEIIELTALEYRLLIMLAQNKGLILSRERLLEFIWDSSGNFVEDNTLTVYVKRLRDKLKNAVNIETVRGMGYRLVNKEK